MKKEEKVRLPYVPTYGEEVANTVSHAVMLPLTLCLLPFAAVWTICTMPGPCWRRCR